MNILTIMASALLFGPGSEEQPSLHCDDPLVIDLNESMAEACEPERGRDALAAAAIAWSDRKGCVTCHTNGAFLLAGAWGPPSELHPPVRAFARRYLARFVEGSEPPAGRHGAIEGLVSTAAFSAIAESRSEGLSEETRAALRHVLDQQDEAGAWNQWLQCRWPPFEVDAHYGATLFAVAAGSSSTDPLWKESKVRREWKRLQGWLQQHPPDGAHQVAMMLWAAQDRPELASKSQRQKWQTTLLDGQRDDGGWSIHEGRHATWPKPPERIESDAYATAFMTFVLLRSGLPTEQDAMTSALLWIRQHQGESGRWSLRSPRGGRHHYLSFTATAFSWMALVEASAEGRRPTGAGGGDQ